MLLKVQMLFKSLMQGGKLTPVTSQILAYIVFSLLTFSLWYIFNVSVKYKLSLIGKIVTVVKEVLNTTSHCGHGKKKVSCSGLAYCCHH